MPAMRASKIAAWAALAVLLSAAMAAAEYSCPSSCDASPGCHCASHVPPAGMANGDTPQFIVLTNDDAITVISQPIIMNITERHTNKNGCKMPATWYVSIDYTEPNLVKNVFVRGHEIATHTVNHVANPNISQIVGARDWLNKTAGIPKEKIGGFRAPYLIFSPEQRDILAGNGFWFDSSISEQYPSTSSPSAAERLWPYTMDYGIPQNCAISTGTCSDSERHPGLWEFPMWNIQDATGTTIASMDPLGDPYELYKREFDQRYNGNRAPLGIYLHAAWLIADPTRADRLNTFLEYAMTHDNVFLVTVSQVLEWIKNPVPASQYSPACPSEAELMALLPQGTSMCVMPTSGCDYGVFDSADCKCKCQNEEINAAGYCRDSATGRCTLQKDYDFNLKTYKCPVANSTAAAASSGGAAATPATDAAGGMGAAPLSTGTSPLTVELDVVGFTAADFQATKAAALCNQLLRLTGDSTATCNVVSIAPAAARRLLQDKLHVIVAIETKNADATVAALKTDTVYTLLPPSGISVVLGSVKAALGAPVVPSPVTTTPTTFPTTGTDATGAATTTTGSTATATESAAAAGAQSTDVAAAEPKSGGGSNTGAIVGAVMGTLAGVAVVCGGVFWWRRRKDATAEAAAPTHSFNPTFHQTSGVTATVRTSRSPTKKHLDAATAITDSPLRDSMVRQ